METKTISVASLLADDPKNWGKWGEDDEVGSLNYLSKDEILRGIGAVRQGKTFTLQIPMCDPGGDPIWPGRQQPQHFMVMDKGDFLAGRGPQFPGEMEYADDVLVTFLHGTTQYDALGHVWCDDRIWNGYDATTTAGGLKKASVFAIAQRGIVGHGVLLDIARLRNKPALDPGETFTHEDLEACAEEQGIAIQKRDILVVRTGWIGRFYREGAEAFYSDFREPGLTYSSELVNWFYEMEIPNLATDTFANEVNNDETSGVFEPLHIALMSNLGVLFTELASLDELADDCADDGQYDFLYTAAPLKVVGGTGAPVNPIVVK